MPFERHIPPSTIRNQYRGCLLGGAVGDALGAPVEFISRREIRQRFGPNGITEYAPAYGRIGAITDDTQMTLFTAEGVMRAHVRGALRGICHPPGVIFNAYLRWLHTQGAHHPKHEHCINGWLVGQRRLFALRAPGKTCLTALMQPESSAVARNDRKGCGGVMRVAPIGMFMASLGRSQGTGDFFRTFDLACAAAAITHGHPTGQLSAGIFAIVVMQLLLGTALPEAISTALQFLRKCPDSGETVTAIESACRLAASHPGKINVIKQLGEGWVAEEALAIALYCALSARDFRHGVIMAVNHDGDSDTTGSMSGQLLGAIHGAKAIPPSWLAELELRDVVEEMADDLATVADWYLDDDDESGETEHYFTRYPGG